MTWGRGTKTVKIKINWKETVQWVWIQVNFWPTYKVIISLYNDEYRILASVLKVVY